MTTNVHNAVSLVSQGRLKGYLKPIEGLRHGWENYNALEDRANFIEETFSSLNLAVKNQAFVFHGRTYRNIIAAAEGVKKDKEWLLLGAHYDAAWGSSKRHIY
jgi:hypothetical protein